MRSRRGSVAALAAALLVTACATSGPKHAEVKATLAPPAPGVGRIYFYRDNTPVGVAVQPEIRLNGEPVGRSVPGGFFFVDRAPGAYVVSVATEVENTTSFELADGQTRYVKTSISMGILVGRVSPAVMDPAQGEADLASLTYIGAPLPPPSADASAARPAAASSAGAVRLDDLKDLLPAR